jgi:putative transposase
LTVVDDCTKEAVEIPVGRRIKGQGVADLLEAICTDQGPEFTSNAIRIID